MKEKYYFDTSIWLDFLENRDEPNMPKSEWARKLVNKISEENGRVILSDNNVLELEDIGYSKHEIEDLLSSLKQFINYIESTEKQIGKAKDLSQKRNIPKRDALHAIIARDSKAVLVTFDNHFKKLIDISKPHNPRDLI